MAIKLDTQIDLSRWDGELNPNSGELLRNEACAIYLGYKLEDDIWIADGVGFKTFGRHLYNTITGLKFHESWDWFIPLAEKFIKENPEEKLDSFYEHILGFDLYECYIFITNKIIHKLVEQKKFTPIR